MPSLGETKQQKVKAKQKQSAINHFVTAPQSCSACHSDRQELRQHTVISLHAQAQHLHDNPRESFTITLTAHTTTPSSCWSFLEEACRLPAFFRVRHVQTNRWWQRVKRHESVNWGVFRSRGPTESIAERDPASASPCARGRQESGGPNPTGAGPPQISCAGGTLLWNSQSLVSRGLLQRRPLARLPGPIPCPHLSPCSQLWPRVLAVNLACRKQRRKA